MNAPTFTFCSEAQMMQHFHKWAKNRMPDREAIIAALQSRIASNAKFLAHVMLDRCSIQKCATRLRKESIESALFDQFQRETNATKQPHGAGWSLHLPASR